MKYSHVFKLSHLFEWAQMSSCFHGIWFYENENYNFYDLFTSELECNVKVCYSKWIGKWHIVQIT